MCYDYGERMGYKLNAILSIGALLPFFIVLLLISIFVLRRMFLLFPIIFLVISLLVNLYAVKFLNGKEQYNPRPIKIVSIDKMKKGGIWLTLISLIFSFIPLLQLTSSLSQIDILIIILVVSIILILIFTFYEQETSVSQILFVRVLFPSFYVAKTDTSSTIFLFSREKLQADRKIKAYHVTDDVYIFGERTNI